ncbi:MAG: endonuclease domain-containing protein [Brevefilum sp.]|nr:endonuclease domain-containing protein [Brevefilum sp.]
MGSGRNITLIPSPSPCEGEGSYQGACNAYRKKNRISHIIRQRPRELRKSSTPAEQKLCQSLRNRNLGDYKFRRQHPIDPYIADFYCAEVGLVIEVDGGGHLDQMANDQDRRDWLEGQGYHVIRFWNDDPPLVILMMLPRKSFITANN